MKKEITEALRKLETEKNIKILYSVESGSRAWGFESKNSDWDVRFFYIHNLDWYLSIEDKKDTIEENLPGDLDLSGWEFRKTLRLFGKSNPPLLEWLKSPIIYLNDGVTAEKLNGLEKEYFNNKSCLYHYYSMAKGTYRDHLQEEYVKIKKYFYVLRSLLACEWIKNRNEAPPVEFEKLVEGELKSESLKNEITRLVEKKKQSEEADPEKKTAELNDYINDRLEFYDMYIKGLPEKTDSSGFSKLNELFRSTLQNSWSP
jgi:predicted nucleotidyltransferase